MPNKTIMEKLVNDFFLVVIRYFRTLRLLIVRPGKSHDLYRMHDATKYCSPLLFFLAGYFALFIFLKIGLARLNSGHVIAGILYEIKLIEFAQFFLIVIPAAIVVVVSVKFWVKAFSHTAQAVFESFAFYWLGLIPYYYLLMAIFILLWRAVTGREQTSYVLAVFFILILGVYIYRLFYQFRSLGAALKVSTLTWLVVLLLFSAGLVIGSIGEAGPYTTADKIEGLKDHNGIYFNNGRNQPVIMLGGNGDSCVIRLDFYLENTFEVPIRMLNQDSMTLSCSEPGAEFSVSLYPLSNRGLPFDSLHFLLELQPGETSHFVVGARLVPRQHQQLRRAVKDQQPIGLWYRTLGRPGRSSLMPISLKNWIVERIT